MLKRCNTVKRGRDEFAVLSISEIHTKNDATYVMKNVVNGEKRLIRAKDDERINRDDFIKKYRAGLIK